MKTKSFLAVFSILIIANILLYSYKTEPQTLQIEVSLSLRVYKASINVTGSGSIDYWLTNTSLIKSHQSGIERVETNINYNFSDAKVAPTQFKIYVSLNQTQRAYLFRSFLYPDPMAR